MTAYMKNLKVLIINGIIMVIIFCALMKFESIESYAAGSQKSMTPILTDGYDANFFTESEEKLIKEAQQKVYEDLGTCIDIYAYTEGEINAQLEDSHFGQPNITSWADQTARNGCITVLYYKYNDEIVVKMRGTGKGSNGVLTHTQNAFDESFYQGGMSYAGFDAYYMLCCDVLNMDKNSVVETWMANTEGNILSKSYYGLDSENTNDAKEPSSTEESQVDTTKPVKTSDEIPVPKLRTDEGPIVRNSDNKVFIIIIFIVLFTIVMAVGTYFFKKHLDKSYVRNK